MCSVLCNLVTLLIKHTEGKFIKNKIERNGGEIVVAEEAKSVVGERATWRASSGEGKRSRHRHRTVRRVVR